MAGQGEGRDDGTEDLFEDLDKFFAPIQGVDWPEPDEGAEEPGGGPPDEDRDEAPYEAEEEPGWETEAEQPEEEPESVPAEAPTSEPSAEEHVFASEESPSESEEVQMDPQAEVSQASESADPEAFHGIEAVEPAAPEVEPAAPVVSDDAIEVIPGDAHESYGFETESEQAAEHFAESVRSQTDDPELVEGAILSDLDESADEPRTVKVDEGLLGPSWQEPTSEEVGGEPVPGPGGRDVSAALLTGVILAALAVGSLWAGRPMFAAVASVIVLLAQGELYAAMHRRHYQPATALGLVFGGLVLAGAYWRGESAMIAMVALCVVFGSIWEMATPARVRRDVIVNIALTTLGVVWIPFFAGFALILLRVEPMGRMLVLATLGLTFGYDTIAFGFGSLWGDHPLAPNVSPRKSREGAIAGTIAVILASIALVPRINGIGVGGAAGLGALIAILAPLGDLAESLIKRDLGLKDMGSMLPGHGGVIDRIDSVLFVAPAALVFLRMLLIG